MTIIVNQDTSSLVGMSFLQLCSRLRQEAGISGTGPSAVTGQIGELQRVIDWILTAYQDTQNRHRDWAFLQNDFAFNTISGTQSYTPTDAGLPELALWKRDEIRLYLTTADEQWLHYCDWAEFRATYLFGANRDQTGRPTIFTIKPDKSIAFWPKPDAIYTCSGEYFKRAQPMTANTDSPLFPEEYHMLLVWMGLMSYGAYEGAPELYARGRENSSILMAKLELDQLPEMQIGEAWI